MLKLKQQIKIVEDAWHSGKTPKHSSHPFKTPAWLLYKYSSGTRIVTTHQDWKSEEVKTKPEGCLLVLWSNYSDTFYRAVIGGFISRDMNL